MNYANLYRDVVDDLMENEGRADVGDIYEAMLWRGAPACVAREYSKEQIRRTAMLRNAEARATRKQRRVENLAKVIDVTQRAFNRILCRKTIADPNNSNRVIVKDFHATKGWRQSSALAS